MARCRECGLLVEENDSYRCFKHNTSLSVEKITSEKECLYFCRRKYEGGEPLPPEQLLLLKKEELKRRKMRGPV